MVHEFESHELRSEILTARDRGFAYYVYVLQYADGTPFYIGKGKRWRLFVHEREARWHRAPKWRAGCSHVKGLLRRGESVNYRIDCFTTTGESACQRETELIIEYGRIDLGTGTLVNRTDGGDNPRNIRSVENLKQWHASNPEKSLETSRKATAASQTPEALARNALAQKEWAKNNPDLAAERRRRGNEGLRMPSSRRKNSEAKKRLFRERPELRKEHSEKIRKWWELHPDHGLRMTQAARAPEAIAKSKASCKEFWDRNPSRKAAREAARIAACTTNEYRERRRQQVLEQFRRRDELKEQCLALCRKHGVPLIVLSSKAGVKMWEKALREIGDRLNVTS